MDTAQGHLGGDRLLGQNPGAGILGLSCRGLTDGHCPQREGPETPHTKGATQGVGVCTLQKAAWPPGSQKFWRNYL